MEMCRVFGTCGGCLYQDKSYKEELKIKETLVKSLLEETGPLPKDAFQPIVASPKIYHYRHRLDLKMVRNRENKVFMGFSPQGDYSFGVVDVDSCPIAMEAVSDSLPEIRKQATERMGDKYRRANVVVRTGDEGYVQWGGIGKGSLKRKSEEYLWTDVLGCRIYFSMETFFQANFSILPKLFECLKNLPLWKANTCFYDLYGGVGLFSIGLADKVKKAILVEENQASIACAEYNKEQNNLTAMEIYRGRTEDIWQTVQWHEYDTHVAMIDPPRDGLTEKASEMLSQEKRLDHILYLSCLPQALARDLEVFKKNNWTIRQVRPFDFFPRTKHVETLVWLSKE